MVAIRSSEDRDRPSLTEATWGPSPFLGHLGLAWKPLVSFFYSAAWSPLRIIWSQHALLHSLSCKTWTLPLSFSITATSHSTLWVPLHTPKHGCRGVHCPPLQLLFPWAPDGRQTEKYASRVSLNIQDPHSGANTYRSHKQQRTFQRCQSYHFRSTDSFSPWVTIDTWRLTWAPALCCLL